MSHIRWTERRGADHESVVRVAFSPPGAAKTPYIGALHPWIFPGWQPRGLLASRAQRCCWALPVLPHPTPETVTNTVAVHVPPFLRLSARAPGRPVAPPWLTLQRETLATDRPRPVVRLARLAR